MTFRHRRRFVNGGVLSLRTFRNKRLIVPDDISSQTMLLNLFNFRETLKSLNTFFSFITVLETKLHKNCRRIALVLVDVFCLHELDLVLFPKLLVKKNHSMLGRFSV